MHAHKNKKRMHQLAGFLRLAAPFAQRLNSDPFAWNITMCLDACSVASPDSWLSSA